MITYAMAIDQYTKLAHEHMDALKECEDFREMYRAESAFSSKVADMYLELAKTMGSDV